ncbi:MAG TPA: hypothetical protein VFY69_10025 [Solirubrobacterales bacterium]|nr:hypothetical protein [Solirubrobacterales bacterium]
MRNVKMLVAAMLVLVAASALVACGSDEETSAELEEIVTGEMIALADAPPAYAEVSGKAELGRGEKGTTVRLSVSGLEPNTAYIAHLHTGGCDQPDPGGPHFQFEKGGSEEPPNEIHLEFTSDAKGNAEAQTRSKREVPPGEAGAVVIHLDEPHEMTGFGSEPEAETIFVHEGMDHSKEGPAHEAEPRHAHSDKIACAELEGAPEAGKGGPTAETDAPTIVVRGGEPIGGVAELEVGAGEDVRFRVSSDQEEEIHVHGYDLTQTVPAGGTVEFDFPADLEGIYEVEMEELGIQIAELRVNP